MMFLLTQIPRLLQISCFRNSPTNKETLNIPGHYRSPNLLQKTFSLRPVLSNNLRLWKAIRQRNSLCVSPLPSFSLIRFLAFWLFLSFSHNTADFVPQLILIRDSPAILLSLSLPTPSFYPSSPPKGEFCLCLYRGYPFNPPQSLSRFYTTRSGLSASRSPFSTSLAFPPV